MRARPAGGRKRMGHGTYGTGSNDSSSLISPQPSNHHETTKERIRDQ